MVKKLSILALIFIVIWSCEDPVTLEFDRLDRRLVIDGGITNLEGPYSIFLSYPSVYSYQPDTEGELERRARNANVEVIDDQGNTFIFEEDPQNPGLYLSDPEEFQGMIGVSYSVRIVTEEGEEYRSDPEKLVEVSEIDSIYSEISGGQYVVYIDMHDPPGLGQFYQWRILFNGRLNDWIDIAPDEFFDGSEVFRFEKDRGSVEDNPLQITVQQLSISNTRYEFLRLFEQQITNGGNPFDSPAAPIVGNVYNVKDKKDYALGYFYSSAVSQRSVVIP